MTELEYPIQSGVFVVVSVFIDPRKPKNPRIVHAAGPFDSRKAATNAAGRMKRRQAADEKRWDETFTVDRHLTYHVTEISPENYADAKALRIVDAALTIVDAEPDAGQLEIAIRTEWEVDGKTSIRYFHLDDDSQPYTFERAIIEKANFHPDAHATVVSRWNLSSKWQVQE